MFSLFNFSSIFPGGQLTPFGPMCGRPCRWRFLPKKKPQLVLAELLCCDCVFCNSLVFYVSAFYFILWAAVSAGYSALLSSSYFERINNDDDDDNDEFQ